MKQSNLSIYGDLQNESHSVQPGTPSKRGKVLCRVFFNHSTGKPQFSGKTELPIKLFDDGTSSIDKLTRSQRVGFVIKD